MLKEKHTLIQKYVYQTIRSVTSINVCGCLCTRIFDIVLRKGIDIYITICISAKG